MKVEHKKDIIVSLVIILLGIYVTYKSTTMKGFGEDVTSPGVLPVILGLLFLILGIALLITTFNKMKSVEKSQEKEAKSFSLFAVKDFFFKKGVQRIIIILILYFVYIKMIILYDFRWVSILFLLACFAVLRNISIWLAAVIAISYPLIIQYVFKIIFRITMP